jgi:RHH-type proline utilization regulon transcriptional repressor/proline dehydrogenase/delta 1-pyrroline-5-carboxylate dehydrogenase
MEVTMKRMLAIVACGLLAAVMVRAQSSSSAKPYKVVFDLTTDDPQDQTAVLRWLRDTGYGLTLGIHSRIQSFADDVVAATRVGNTYVNRSMIGAVVGVQPFGGEGLSGTGPKAGGPHYMSRFATERTLTINTAAIGGVTELLSQPAPRTP